MRNQIIGVTAGTILISLIVATYVVGFGRAATSNRIDWFTRNPTVFKEQDYSTQPSLFVDKCTPTNVQVSNESQYRQLCMAPTAMGLMSRLYHNQGYVQPQGYSKAYRVDYIQGGNQIIQPVPNQASGVFWATGSSNFATMGLYYQIANHMQFNSNPLNMSYSINFGQLPDTVFRHPSGENVRFSLNDYTFAQNGRYMVASNNQGFMRINIMNPTIRFFSSPQANIYGSWSEVAIDNSGRYAAVIINTPQDDRYTSFKVVDIESCNIATPVTVNSPTPDYSGCTTSDIFPSLKSAIPGLKSIRKTQFMNDRTMTFIAEYQQGTVTKYALYSVTAGGELKSLKNYMALGDSYISGEGAHSYREGTDTERNQCHQSLLSYPYLLGNQQSSFASVACSGARIHNVRYGQEGDNTRIDQLIGSILPGTQEKVLALEQRMPGVLPQHELTDEDQPEAITLSIGGNDIGFGDILTKCVDPHKNLRDQVATHSTCYDTYEDRMEVVELINAQFTRLRSLYTELKNNGAAGRRVYVIGYPQVAKPGGDCGNNVLMNAEEVKFSHDLINYLNKVIKRAADEAGVQYVDTRQAFDGHRLCEAAAGQAAMNGFTITKNPRGEYDFKASYHPNQLGHQLLAQVIAAQTNNLSKPMPVAAPISNQMTADLTDPVLAGVPKTNRALRYVRSVTDLVPKIVNPSQTFNFLVETAEFYTKPQNMYSLVIKSTPVNLGSFQAAATGDVNVSAQIPANMPPGFHTLHFYGADMFGNQIDIQQVVYVTAGADDIDGDGVPNVSDSCVLAAQSTADADADGIDDVCDLLISVPPSTPPGEPAGITWWDNGIMPITIQATSGP